jgi:hypothetical protein
MFDRIVLVDQSTFTPAPTAVASPDRPRAFIPIFSTKGFGKDDEVKLFEAYNHGTLVKNYGNPNILITLAPLYYAYEFLRGGGDVYIRRIVSATAAHAHIVIVAKVRFPSEGANEGKAEVIFENRTLNSATDLETMITDAEDLLNLTPDADGFVVYPIAITGVSWKGVEGNKYTIRLIPNTSLDKQIDQKAYTLETRESASSSPKSVGFTFDENATLDGQSIYANDIFEEQSPNVFFNVLSTYSQFIEAIKDYIPEGEIGRPDIFFGRDKSGNIYPDYVILNTSVDYTVSGGIAMQGGSDGSFAVDQANREDSMMERYVESFDEMPTQMLENEYKYFIDYVFDFGAPQEVKDAIIGFTQRRKTTKAIIDTGLNNKTVTSIVNARVSGGVTYSNESAIIVSGVAAYRDPFTNKKIMMPLSFFEAFAVPNHISMYEGGARPFAGANYTYDNMIPGTYQPIIYDENSDSARKLVDNQINFAVEDANTYQAFHQTTSLKVRSLGLGERNNVHLLHLMIRLCLLEAKAERWNFLEDADIERYGSRIQQRLEIAMQGKVGELSIQTERAGQYGEDRNRVNVTINVRFKNINKGTTFTFTIN